MKDRTFGICLILAMLFGTFLALMDNGYLFRNAYSDTYLGSSAQREFKGYAMTTGETQTTLTESLIRRYRTITNQGGTTETDAKLPDVSYPIYVIFEDQEGQVFEVCPPTGETMWIDGDTSSMDANDCIDSDGTMGSIATAYRVQDASAAFHWHLISSIGLWSDTGATD